ncbi:MAG TPA: hypothetical protein VMZ27_09465 [Candidatus Saccharimonadales bacterium]|nr:hypothetical protein [Candidatus Saccharimonadales bacterium]
MRRALLILAMVVALSAATIWLATGRNVGWTKTVVEIHTVEEVTGLDGITYRKGFYPGLDFMIGCLGFSLLLAGSSIFFRNKQNARTV